jgi:hypothetical protein
MDQELGQLFQRLEARGLTRLDVLDAPDYVVAIRLC